MGLITELELRALKPDDKGKTVSFGGSMYGRVHVSVDGAVSVNVTWRYKTAGKARENRIDTWRPKGGMSLKAIFAERERLGVALRLEGDSVAIRQDQLAQDARQQVLEQERLEDEHQAALLQIEADKQQAILEQQRRLQHLAAMQARMTVKGLFEQWQHLELNRRADQGREALRSFRRDVFALID